MIIDIHSHLGDILNPDGGQLIFRKGVRKKFIFDPTTLSELSLHSSFPGPVGDFIYFLFFNLVTRASRARNDTATLENMRISMDRNSVAKTACMPIPPYLRFEDLKKAMAHDDGIIPFTGIDFTRPDEIAVRLESDVAQGAKGLKLHPIIQNIPFDDERTIQAVETFSTYQLPILFHCGISSYYLGAEREARENSTYGNIRAAEGLVSRFPNTLFIAGHAGLFKWREVVERLSRYNNVYVDISFQSPQHIRTLIDAFGAERVLFASDWPYGKRRTAIKAVQKACLGDKSLENALFYENACRLLSLPVPSR